MRVGIAAGVAVLAVLGAAMVTLAASEKAGESKVIAALRAENDGALRRALDSGESPRVVDADGNPAIAIAASAGRAEAVRLLLQRGADPNTRVQLRGGAITNAPVLIMPAANGSLATLQVLAEAGAQLDASDSSGLTALMAASYSGHDPIVSYLLQHGASVGARDGVGYTALMFAANAGHASVCRMLLARGAKANARDKEGSTPLMFAAQHGFDDVVTVLLSAGADPRQKGSHGLSAIGFAEQNHRDSTLRLLQR